MKREATILAFAILAAMAVASVLILVYGESPLHVYSVMLSRTWGDAYGVGQVLFKSTPLVFTGLAVAMAFQVGLFNIGGEGQLLVGSFASALVGAALPAMVPAWFAIPMCVVAGAGAGAALAFVPGVLKVRFHSHEVINTIMLNFISQALVLWAGRRFFFVAETVHTKLVLPAARVPSLGLSDSAANAAFLLALLAAVGCHWLLSRSRLGYQMRAVGKGAAAAETAGISLSRMILFAMALSGALAGMVGSSLVLGYKGYFEEGMGSGAGFMGIAVALLARSRPLGVIPAALLFGTLSQGGLAANALVPKEILDVLQAVVILGVAVASAELRRSDRSFA